MRIYYRTARLTPRVDVVVRAARRSFFDNEEVLGWAADKAADRR
jgi:hypothetical protein